jgi:hypothetical protein
MRLAKLDSCADDHMLESYYSQLLLLVIVNILELLAVLITAIVFSFGEEIT